MEAMRSTIAAAGWLAASAVFAQIPDLEVEGDGLRASALSVSYSASGDLDSSELVAGLPGAGSNAPSGATALVSGDALERAGGVSIHRLIMPHLAAAHGVYAKVDVQSFSSPETSVSYIRQLTGIDARSFLSSDYWFANGSSIVQSFSVGHDWNALRLEGVSVSNISPQRIGQQPLNEHREVRSIDSRSAWLSFSPAPNWTVRLSRGTVSGLDNFIAGDEVRRTAISATWRQSFAEGDWEATVAWGRNSRKFRESTVGYLVESAFRFSGIHSLFGRVEQVGSDEILRENESMQRQLFTMNKLTLGYAQDLRITSSLRVDAGAYVTRYFVPSAMVASYGAGPTAYIMFIRAKLQ